MNKYNKQVRHLVAVDCIIFGFDCRELKLLLIHRGFEPERGKWSLMGGFVEEESLEMAAARILKQLTGLSGVYLEQLQTFGDPRRDPVERTISVAYYSLIDIHQYEQQLSEDFRPEWFSLKKIPKLVFDHNQMVEIAKAKLRDKASAHPLLFELLPEKFTLPVVQNLYESVYEQTFDKRNFSRKVLASGLLLKTKDKEKLSSKKGAFYHRLNRRKYKTQFQSFLNFNPVPQI
jgi:8-oxo-dGTP diphosphatase